MNGEDNNLETNDLDRWIDSLLRSEFATALETPPRGLVGSIRAVASRRRRQRRYIACGLAAAALMVAVGWIAMEMRSGNKINARVLNDVASVTGIAQPSPSPSLQGRGPVEPPQATFVGTGNTIAMPLESGGPDVTIVQTYSTLDAQRSRELMAGIYPIPLQPDGG